MALSKFKTGQLVDFNPARPQIAASIREYKILRLLPREDGSEQQYRIKSVGELFERVAKESDLSER